jgi:hypothetical protein
VVAERLEVGSESVVISGASCGVEEDVEFCCLFFGEEFDDLESLWSSACREECRVAPELERVGET